MDLDHINEQGNPKRTQSPKPVIARRKGEIGAVMIDPKTGKPIPDTWVPKAEVPEKALKYLDPAKFAAAEKRNKDRQAQIDAERERLKGVGNPPGVPSSASEPPKQQPPRRQPAPPAQPSPVAKYMAAASAARKSGDPTQMAKARDMGMEIWKNKYKDTLAKNVKTPTTPSMANQAAGIRDMQRASQLRQQGQNVMGSNITSVRQDFEKANRPEVLNRPAPSVTALRAQQDMKKNALKKEAYDIVLDYLLSEGHVESLDEALYVMMEMDAETIGTIVEAAKDQSDKQIEKGVKTTYKAGNVIDNQHQGRSRGLNRLSATERAAKVERMRKRLKARRDDLFGERNRREDATREEMRRKYGL